MKSKIKMCLLAVGIVLTLANAGCGNPTTTPEKTAVPKEVSVEGLPNDSTIKVYVDASGKITADGIPADLTLLDSAFSQLKKAGGKVCYSRDNIQGDPPAESIKVLDLVVKYELPLQFYTDKSFTKVAEVK